MEKNENLNTKRWT